MLQMKAECERCQSPTEWDGVAFICSYECTFCEECANRMDRACPNCGGELRRRPARARSVENRSP